MGESTITRKAGETPASAFGDGVYCPCCNYHLRGIPEAQCPECGFAYDHPGIRWAARGAACEQDRAVRGTIRTAVLACALLLSEAVKTGWPSLPAQVVCVLLALLLALAVYWYYEDLRPPTPWQNTWKAMALLACFDIAVILIFLPPVGRWAGLICCFYAWAAWFGYASPYREALAAIGVADRTWIQHRKALSLGLLGLSSCMVFFAWF